ncbi:MAG: hypothetical protein JWQ87_1324 [Candidatus Sulfotelmatobacter sp.]|nr:hypothetical protein [Candidatus Sulfotelmatobacter sp.]
MLNAGKYVLALPLFAIAAVRSLGKASLPKHWTLALGTLFLSIYALSKLIGDGQTKYVDLSFWTLFSLVLVWGVDAVTVPAIDRYLRYLLIYALGSTLIEVVLFIAFGRLPALAFEGTYFIRFGGFLDDPNGFSAVLFLLMGWSYGRFKGQTRSYVLASIVVCLLLTQSWTGLAFLVLILFLWALVGISKRPGLAIVALCATALIVVLGMHTITRSPAEIIEEVLTAKQESIEGHLFPLQKVASSWSEWAVEGNTIYTTYESWWAGALINFGVLWYCAWFSLVAALIISLRRGLSRCVCEAKPVYLGFFLFGCYFAFGSISLPYPIIFPINVFFFVFSFLVAFGKIRLEDGSPAVLAPGMAALQ